MNDQEIKKWAKEFAAELKLADEPAIIDQVVGRHLATLDFLKSRIRWKGIVNILTQAGARREDGKSALSEDQLRASRSRMRRRQQASGTRATHYHGELPPERIGQSERRASTVISSDRKQNVRPETMSKEISDAEVAAALGRMARIGSTTKRKH